MKTKKLYQVREYVGSSYSKLLGRRLRSRTRRVASRAPVEKGRP